MGRCVEINLASFLTLALPPILVALSFCKSGLREKANVRLTDFCTNTQIVNST